MQQWWFDDGLGLKSGIYGVCFFFRFSPHFKVFINIHEYKNEVICIAGHGITGTCLTFKLVPRLVVYNKY